MILAAVLAIYVVWIAVVGIYLFGPQIRFALRRSHGIEIPLGHHRVGR